jgi:trigger factor
MDQSQTKLTITVTPADYQKHLESASERLSARGGIKGFRPGKVPLDVMKREIGDMAILNEALESIVRETFVSAVDAEKLETIGMPHIQMEKVAPGNDLVYTAVVSLLPPVTVADMSKINVKKTVKPVDEQKVDETIAALRGMQAVEAPKEGPSEKTDKLVIDMAMSLDGVPVEGGQAKDYQVYLSEEHYIPGFNDAIVGAAAGEKKTFTLTFPQTHYQKMLAGKAVDFAVTVKSVCTRTLPEADDAFAATLGQKSIADLRDLVRKNMEHEAGEKAEQQAEIAIFDALIEASSFGSIPDILVDAEKQKMFYELKRDLEKNGVTIEQYLADIKKKEEEVLKEFTDQAVKRAKAALLSRVIAKEHQLAATAQEVSDELEFLKKTYRDQPEYMENLKKPEVRDTIATMIQNRKVIQWLKKRVLDGEKNA